ncbi:sugar ABC transporter ATP-binding protein [Bradyrhizobium sp. RDM4]|uniref:sugar ABC transporter ATP-binding protein n=1 Tax=Bradyrhizobium sp. RDM4 TaxID=3378765 RepID=UPI0038FCBD1F
MSSDSPPPSEEEAAQRARSAILRVDHIFKRFGGTQALNDVSIDVGRGEVVALLGENGAGKSTLIKILAGVYAVDTGTIFHEETDVTSAIRRMPISFIHQDLGLIEWMTVAENICLTLGYPRRFGLIEWSRARTRAELALAKLGVDIDPDLRVRNLTRTEKSLVAIARALATDAEILVLDEPTASLPADEVMRLFGALRRLREHNVGMIYVSHRLDEVFEIADRMVVLRDGRVAGERVVAHTSPDETILLIVGREPSQVFRRPGEREGAAQLELEAAMIGSVGPIDCRIHAGEIVGLVGLRGAGQEQVSRALFGVEAITSGQIRIDGVAIELDSPRRAMDRGVNLVCADRVGESIVAGLSVRENFFLNPQAAGCSSLAWLSPAKERGASKRLGDTVGLRPNDPDLAIELLSGETSKKVAVGRWLNLKSKIYIFEDPTAGVDVGSKAEIYKLFDVALKEGAAILIVSTDFEEVSKVCHRALVFSHGQVVRELHSEDLSISNLLSAASASVAWDGVTAAGAIH